MYVERVPKCEEHDISLDIEMKVFVPKNKKAEIPSLGVGVYYCPKCDAYLTKEGMKKDLIEAVKLSPMSEMFKKYSSELELKVLE